MTVKILPILLLYFITTINATKGENSFAALKKLLYELTTSKNSYNDRFSAYQTGNKREKHRHHGEDSANLMNVQTMNLFLKPNKRQREEAEIEQWLRTEDKMCKITGRCGCTGSRCDTNSADDKIAEEVDKFVDEINRQLPREDDDHQYNYRELDDKDNRQNEETYEVGGERIYEKDTISDSNNDRDQDDADEDVSEIDKLLRCYGQQCFDDKNNIQAQDFRDNDLLNSKTIKFGDNIDVVILDRSDLEKLLRNEDFKDLTRNDPQNENINQEIHQKVLAEYKKFIDTYEKTGPHRSAISITPEDFFNEYEPIKKQVLSKALTFVKNKKPFSFLKLKHLTLNQKRKLRRLKTMFNRGEVEESDVEDGIVKIIFGEGSNMQILAHDNNNNNIYVPNWIYDNLISLKKNLRYPENIRLKKLRTHKRILPLTTQQKERMNNKKGRTIPKLVWRRNPGQDVSKFGIPFDFDVHGLGQIAP